MKNQWLVIVFALICGLAPATGRPQIPLTSTEAESVATPVPVAVAPRIVRAEVLSPRATVRTLIRSVISAGEEPDDKSHIERAASCLDLSEISELVREDQGQALAVKLKGIFDRIERVDFASIPDDPDSAESYYYPWQNDIFVARQPTGEWLFSAETVAKIDDLYREYEDRKTVEGIVETPESIIPGLSIRSKIPESLRHRALWLESWQWLGLLLLAFIGIATDRITTKLIEIILVTRLRRWLSEVDKDLIRDSLRPFGLLIMSGVWAVLIRWLDLPTPILIKLVVAIRFVAVTSFVWGSYRLVDVASAALEVQARRTHTRFDDLLIPLFRKSFKVFIVAFGIVFIAQTMDVRISSLLAGLGIGGLAFAFAAQDTVANLFGSLTIVLDRPFEVGDWIIIGDLEGSVEEVGFRSTRIRTFYNSVITVPNSKINNSAVDNMGARTYRRWKTMIGIEYDTPPEKIEAFTEGIRELVRKHPYTRKDYFHVYLNGFGPSSLDILLYSFHEVPDWGTELRERHRLAMDIIRLAKQLGVEFAFPTQTVFVKSGAAAAGGDASGSVDDALALGRSEADAIVKHLLGTDGEKPPPVTYS